MKPEVTALLIMGRDRRLHLLEQLEVCDIEVVPVCDCSDAGRVLAAHPVHVVLTDTDLPDGDWRAVLKEVGRSGTNAEVVVCARLADATLWCDVLESGAYDLLIEPYQCDEVRRIIEAAAARRHMRSLPTARESRVGLQARKADAA